MKGTIKRLNEGFGFIRGDDRTDYFMHHSAVQNVRFDQLREGQTVEFDPNPDAPKGPRAEQVFLADAAA